MAALLLPLLLLNLPAEADVFLGLGQAVLVNDDRASAQELALKVARSDALGKAMEAYVANAGVDKHRFNIKKGELLAGGRAFVRDERLTSARFESPLLRVELELDIDMMLLERALGGEGLISSERAASRKQARPRTMVLVAEEINGGMNSFPYSAQIIQKQLLSADYEVVDSTAAKAVNAHDQAVLAVFNNDSASARAMALRFDAGMTITGRAVVQKSALSAGGMQSYGANVALTAIQSDTGRVLASATESGTYPHVNAITGSRLAIEEASQKAIAELLAKLAATDQQLATDVRLNIDGVNYEQLAILKQLLERDFPSLISMKTLGFGGDVARLQLALGSSSSEFAEALARKNFGSFKLRVLSQSNAKIDTTVVLSR